MFHQLSKHLIVFSTLYSVFGCSDEILSLVFDILHQTLNCLTCIRNVYTTVWLDSTTGDLEGIIQHGTLHSHVTLGGVDSVNQCLKRHPLHWKSSLSKGERKHNRVTRGKISKAGAVFNFPKGFNTKSRGLKPILVRVILLCSWARHSALTVTLDLSTWVHKQKGGGGS